MKLSESFSLRISDKHIQKICQKPKIESGWKERVQDKLHKAKNKSVKLLSSISHPKQPTMNNYPEDPKMNQLKFNMQYSE